MNRCYPCLATPQPPVVAIGDVHGCATLLREAVWPHLGSGAELIFLGDLIDRSPESDGDRQVIELVRELQVNPEAYGLAGVTVLRGWLPDTCRLRQSCDNQRCAVAWLWR